MPHVHRGEDDATSSARCSDGSRPADHPTAADATSQRPQSAALSGERLMSRVARRQAVLICCAAVLLQLPGTFDAHPACSVWSWLSCDPPMPLHPPAPGCAGVTQASDRPVLGASYAAACAAQAGLRKIKVKPSGPSRVGAGRGRGSSAGARRRPGSAEPASARRRLGDGLDTPSAGFGEAVVGARIGIWWPADEAYYRVSGATLHSRS